MAWFTRLSLCLAFAGTLAPSASFASDTGTHPAKHVTPRAGGHHARPQSVRAFPVAKLRNPPPRARAPHKTVKPAGTNA